MSTGDFKDEYTKRFFDQIMKDLISTPVPLGVSSGGAGGGSTINTGVTGAAGSMGSIGAVGGGGGSGGYGYISNPKIIIDDYYNDHFPSPVKVRQTTPTIQVHLDDGSISQVSREELVKYIEERKLRQENELVRTQWDRYQVAVKIVGSTDHGQEDEG